jgi:hypothetical protein
MAAMHYYHCKGRYDDEYEKLWQQLVPASGQAATVQGELVRVIGRLTDEFYRNGNGNWNLGYRRFTNFLHRHLLDDTVFAAHALAEIKEDIEMIRRLGSNKENSYDFKASEDAFDRVTNRVVEWCRQQPELIARELNPKLKR